ncbi:MAG TPA: LOG family protein [Oligoflexia bacterium]|nr:LOG family protein [Oligoflexia bacterium]HMP49572.1 LOG family protein [Oligoflexia bacterium]
MSKDIKKARRARLNERLGALRDRVRVLELELAEYTSEFYRVCIFGSARIKPDDSMYQITNRLGECLGELGLDVLTGGGPGLMEAANKGVLEGKKKAGTKSKSFGLTIELNKFEEEASEHLDIKHHHRRFSSRLDDFMRLSNAVVVMRGGIGTLLELYFTWQLIQVGHMPNRPFILVDKKFWEGLIKWMEESLVVHGLISPGDMHFVELVDTPEEAAAIIKADYEAFIKEHGNNPE